MSPSGRWSRRRAHGALARLLRPKSKPGLLMIYRREAAPVGSPLPHGYSLRTWRPGDDDAWLALLNRNGQFGEWSRERLDRESATLIRKAQFFICQGEQLVATTGVYDRPREGRPAYEIGWVAADPAHFGRGLGRTVVAAAVGAAVAAGGRPILLSTEDFRLPAIAIYLQLGFSPDLTGHRGYARRWESVLAVLARERPGDLPGGTAPQPGAQRRG